MAVTITEEPVTIAEEPVTIAEDPVTIAEDPVTTATDPVTTSQEPATAEAVEEPVLKEAEPKKRGRPVGSKNKEPGKPRAPRKKPEIVEEPIEQELPRAVEGSFPIPEEAYDLRTAKMLRLLQMQADQRKRNKENVWRNLYG